MKALHLFSIVLLFIPGVIYAEQYGIALSPTCIIMIKNNLDTNCPTIPEINQLFPDTTNKLFLGDFSMIDGMIQREPPKLLHPERYYTYFTGDVMWVDPPNEVRKKINMIYIEPSIPEYKIGDESLKMNDYSISFQKDRYVNPNCSESKITAKNWVFLTGDTLNYMKHDCDKVFTSFDGMVTLQFAKSYQDISTSFKYIHDKWVSENLIKCKVKGC